MRTTSLHNNERENRVKEWVIINTIPMIYSPDKILFYCKYPLSLNDYYYGQKDYF
jgi:hypothetical protein